MNGSGDGVDVGREARVAVDCRNRHGEGVFWNPADRRVWWTDIDGERLWWLDPVSGASDSIQVPGRVCCFAPRAAGGFVVAFADGFAFFDPAEGVRRDIAPFEPGNPRTRTNDGRTDRQGRFVVGGMNEDTSQADSSVVRLDPDGTVKVLLRGIGCANSICFSPDGHTLYFTDTPKGEILAFEYDPATGRPGGRRRLIGFEDQPGLPDGSCVDAEGFVWNAQWGGGRVARIAPDGRLDRVIELPVPNPTCCAFGGPELDTLFMTSSRQGMSDEQIAAAPLSGALFAVKPDVRGLPDTPFAG